jgi:hypothetical protein
MAWWCFEAPGGLKYPGYYSERSTLWRAGVLGSEERLEVEAEWRHDFDDAARRMSARERREHYEHHDIPAELIQAWTPPRRRRARAQGVASKPAQENAPDVASIVEGEGAENLRVEQSSAIAAALK